MPYLTSSLGIKRWKKEAELLIAQALLEKQKLLHEAEKEISEKKRALVSDHEQLNEKWIKREKSIQQKEAALKKKEEELQTITQRLEERRKKADSRMEELRAKESLLEEELLKKASLSANEAYQLALNSLIENQKNRFLEHKNQFLQELLEEEKRKIESALEDTLLATYNSLTSHVHVSVLKLSQDTSLPRLIGKEGKNIEGLASLSGCDLWVDDERKELLICSYDDQKRFVAERMFTQLISKDLFTLNQAAHIKHTIETDLEKEFARKGIETIETLALPCTYPDAVLAAIGSLSLRTSHGQNVLLHSIETAKMAKIAALSLGFSCDLAAQIGLFHDIGKGLDLSWGARHPERGRSFLSHHGLPSKICEGVSSHHLSSNHTSHESLLIHYLDALSARGCAKRLMHHATPFHKLQQQLEKIPCIISSWCVDLQTKILVLLRTREGPFSTEALEDVLQRQDFLLPIEEHLIDLSSTASQPRIFLPEKK